ncbi:MAG TPA: BREX system serine/threonine kinase PglW [Planctomycetaceae bacterium]|nr:BREX system serine/threonine kinase PglW [Planctomycetaceae bacterium]
MSSNWTTVTESKFPWEREAFEFIKAGFPTHEPYRAWSNFEFIAEDGNVYEVDLLVLAKRGFWLVECKAWSGRIWGDPGTWTRQYEGRVHSEDNPLLLANRKAKALAGLLSKESTLGKRVPFLEPLIFLSAPNLQCELAGSARTRVLLRDQPRTNTRPEQKGILAALINREGPGIDPEPRGHIDATVARALSRDMEDKLGIRTTQRSRRVGDYILEDLLCDRPGYQDWLAKHAAFENVYCRVRQYTVVRPTTDDERERLRRAAAREFQIIQTLDHPNILPVLDYREHEHGPTLLFRYVDKAAVRFDHFLATRGWKLTTTQRLDLLRQVADAIRYAHRKRVIHRSLGPQSILVSEAESATPRLQVFNWQVGVRDTGTSSVPVTQVDDLVESQSLVYMSPEALSDSRKVSEASDVFSLGAIAFHLFANRPPAGNAAELARLLRDQKGLRISAVLDGAGQKLEELIQWSTHPNVLNRIGSVEDFLVLLGEVEEELTAPAATVVADPLVARQGDRLPEDFLVKRELGQGATAKALLVSRDDQEWVLKVALNQDNNTRLHEEAEALRSLQSEFIVAIEKETTMHGRTVLVLQKAGDQTLATLLAKEGIPSLDLLSRYGDDLLSAVCSLERHGVVHRDIKPDNIGIRSLTKQRNQLILFDFSLARAPLENLKLGTEGYRDPFLDLRRPPRWDLAAERYSAAVTLYEMTLGAGARPRWGSGKSDPALTDEPLVLDAEKFDPSLRDGLIAFFQRALDRDPARRFDSAYDMQTAWRHVFTQADQRKITTPQGAEIDVGVSFDKAELGTPVSALGLSTRARNALERANVVTVRELLGFPIGDIHLMKGVGNQTRQEIIAFVGNLRERFPDVVPARRPEPPPDEETAGPTSLEALHQRIVGLRNPKKEGEWNIRQGVLGSLGPGGQSPNTWPSQSEVAEVLQISRARVGAVISADRNRWSKDPQVTLLRTELCEQIQRLGGVVTIGELIDLTILLRPAANSVDAAQALQLASAVARAAVETEDQMAQRRFQLRRVAGKVVVACSQELAVFAEKLGQVADRLAKSDPLASPMRVFQELYDVPQPPQPLGCQPFTNERLLNLAAAMGLTAAVSTRQEIYPRGMSAERALRLGMGALSGLGLGEPLKGFTVAEIRERVASRYPAAQPLPDRTELDDLLKLVGLDVRWDIGAGKYLRRETTPQFTSGSSIPMRNSTAHTSRQVEVTPDVAEARTFEERLQHAWQRGGFLVLTVRPSRMRAAEAELLRRFPLCRISFDELFFELLQQEASELEVDWDVVERADGANPASEDWKNLTYLISRIRPRLIERLAQEPRQVLLVNPGLIARYDLMSVLETLRDTVGHDAPCPGLWVLVPTDGQSHLPFLDQAEIPLITAGQRARVAEGWVDNRHRGRRKEEG